MKTNKYIDSRLVVTRGESGEVGIKGVRFLVTEGNLTLFDEQVPLETCLMLLIDVTQ